MATKKPTNLKESGAATGSSTLFEVIVTDSHSVKCDGGKGALGHPRVFLEIPPTKSDVTCPYCSRSFVYAANH